MARAIIFFVCMFALLLGRDATVFATAYHPYHHNCSRYTLAPKADNTRRIKIPDIRIHSSKLRETELDKGTKYFVTDKVEDDDDSSSSARKYKLLARFYLAFSAAFPADNSHERINTPPVFIEYLSNKYIVQRVLRI